MRLSIRHWAMVVLAISGAILALASCGSDEGGGDATADASTDSAAVSIGEIDGTEVLVDSEGRALYTSKPEENGKVVCTRACTSIWDPVLAAGDESESSDVGGELGTVRRPEGEEQLTFDGAPLYSFTEEGPGEVTGDGLVDDFEGTQFEWQVATPTDGSSAGGSDQDIPSGGVY